MPGSFIHSLVAAADVCTGWTEAVPLLAREQSPVVEGLEAIGRQLPFSIRGIDSDNDSAFINETLIRWCNERGIEFTRSRAYRKNDQAWIEQKNGAVVRRFVGYDRYSGPVAGQTMAYLYGVVRLYVNYFQPSFKLVEKTRDGASVVKRYSPPATPCDRLMQHDTVSAKLVAKLSEFRAGLDPVALLPMSATRIFEYLVRQGTVQHFDALAALVSALVEHSGTPEEATIELAADVTADLLAPAANKPFPALASAIESAAERTSGGPFASGLVESMVARTDRYALPTALLPPM